MTFLLDLPEDVWRHVASNLAAPDLLQFLSCHRRLHEGLGHSTAFWKFLLPNQTSTVSSATTISYREQYMMHAYRRHLPVVQWLPRLLRSAISPREGHLACVFSSEKWEDDMICMTGGFTNDDTVYLLPSVTTMDDQQNWRWQRVMPTGHQSFVYGSTLTPLDSTRAVRVGGFRAGGYSAETNEVAVLSLSQELEEEVPVSYDIAAAAAAATTTTTVADSSDDSFTRHWSYKARWDLIQPQNPHYCIARAYHTATLLNGRYLLILGGMTSRGCVIQEAILDTKTWTWLDPYRITIAGVTSENKPSGRHGHSVVLDGKRDRLVLFGGGSGTDLLRSGTDNSEVWELQLGIGWQTNLEASLPWTWKELYTNTDMTSDNQGNNNEEDDSSPFEPLLTPVEMLCLGRCHHGIKVSPDTALLLFGSGRPSTNGVLAYDMQLDQFLHPQIRGPLPCPRFTFASALVERYGYLILHGGYTTQEGEAVSQMTILDLAPLLPSRSTAASGLRIFPAVDPHYESYDAITEGDAQRGRRRRSGAFLHQLINAMDDEGEGPNGVAADMLDHLIANGQYGGRSIMLMNMLANGEAAVRFGGMDADDGDDDDEVQEEKEDASMFNDSDYQDEIQ